VAVQQKSQGMLRAVEEFNKHEHREDGDRVVGTLFYGLSLLSDSLYRRMHHDVEEMVGVDSMLMPVNKLKAAQTTSEEIDIYQTAESAAAADRLDYLSAGDDWYLEWLGRLRLGRLGADTKIIKRIAEYRSLDNDQRRLAFTDALARVLPESRMTPLVLFRLFPLAIQITTALSFRDNETAMELRRRQLSTLPIIGDCRKCGGRVMEIGEQCQMCGNPLWKYKWLISAE